MNQSIAIPEHVLDQWQQIVEIMARLLHVPSAIITRVDLPQIEVFRASRNPENPYHAGQRVEIANHYCEAVVQSRERLRIVHAPDEDRWKNAPEIAYGIVSYLGYPIQWPDGEIFGTLCVLDSKANPYGPEYEQLLEQFRSLVEAHLVLIHQREELERSRAELQQRLDEIKTLRGIIPICAGCKKIRNDAGYWEQVEQYIAARSEADFSHGLCPACAQRLYGYRRPSKQAK